MKKSWDKGVDYVHMYNKLVKLTKNNNIYTKCYASILLTQLRNGARVSEAVRAFREFLRTNNNIVYIKVSKKKKEETRMIVIPPEILDLDLIDCYDLVNDSDSKVSNKIAQWSLSHLKVNTHSLRYAFITYLLKQNVNPAVIAKITKHSKLDYILTYTQAKQAEEILKNM